MKPGIKEVLIAFGLTASVLAAQEAPPSPRATQRGLFSYSLDWEGRTRTYLVYAPRGSRPKSPYAVVIMLHGGGGTGRGALEETGWAAKAEREGFLAVFPDALPRDPAKPARFADNPPVWNDGSERFEQGRDAPDDVGFIARLIDDVDARYPLYRKRIFLTGFSNGASLCFRAAAALSTRVAAAAPCAGALWQENPSLERPVSLCYISGTADPLNPLEGGAPTTAAGRRLGLPERPKPPVADSIRAWARALDCPLESPALREENGVRMEMYGPGREGAVVVYITVEGMGHHWAGGRSRLPESVLGKWSGAINATDVIWDFFEAHPMP